MDHQHDPDEPGSRTPGSGPPENAGVEAPTPEPQLGVDHRNEVLLVGRITSSLRKRGLPSGDVVGTLRIVVNRTTQPRPGRKSAGFDAIDCASWNPKTHKKLEKWTIGDVIQVSGSIRRRFFRTNNNVPTSRYEVEVHEALLLARAAQVQPKPRKEKQPPTPKPEAA